MDPLQNILQPYIDKLKPIQAFSDKMSYENFSKPFETYIKGAADTYKPWYEYFTAKPQKQTLAGQMAAGGASGTGFGQGVAQRSLRELYQPLQEALYGQNGINEQYKTSLINPLYERRMKEYYQSPTTGFNF